METTEFIERLNADLGTECQSIVQYVQHVATIKGAEYRSMPASAAGAGNASLSMPATRSGRNATSAHGT
jgi:hypothetical protein